MEKAENYIACCGFYCKTCKEFTGKHCRGCKTGYENKDRDLSKAKCNIKLCCYRDKEYRTCADCDIFSSCSIITKRFKPGTYSNKKCMQYLQYIKNNGYVAFIKKANNWHNHYGTL